MTDDADPDRLLDTFFAACSSGDVAALATMLDGDASLVNRRTPDGATPLHLAVAHPDALRLLLTRGANPNARDAGDNALALHFAAGGGPIDSVRLLLDAGSDVHGHGDAHELDVIGFATVFDETSPDVVELLVARGARHHVFSAIALGDTDLLRQVVADDPRALDRRLSVHEQQQSALHYVVAPPDGLIGGRFRTGAHYHTLSVLIELGADIEARDARDRTPLELAMLHGDHEAMHRLRDAGARIPRADAGSATSHATLANAIGRLTPMLSVPDVDATVAWYRTLGFELVGSHRTQERLDFAAVRLGDAELMLVPGDGRATAARRGLSLWIETSQIDELHATLRALRLARAAAELEHGAASDDPDVAFKTDLHTAFYGQREFCIRDPNGVEICFYQPLT